MTREVKDEKQSTKNDGSDKKKARDTPNTKVVIRCLPPTLTEAEFFEQISPVPDNDYLCYVKADRSLEANAFCRAYINFVNPDDVLLFHERWDGCMFADTKGIEYPAVVEFAPYQKIPKSQGRKMDLRCGTIDDDDDFKAFCESLQAEVERLPSAETYLEELEARLTEKEAKEMTPLLVFIKNKKIERMKLRQEAKEERRRKEREQKRRDDERRLKRDEERRRQRERQRQKEQREAKEKKGGDTDKDEPQKIKLLKKPEGEVGSKKSDSAVEKKSQDAGKRDHQARQDNRKEKDSRPPFKADKDQRSSSAREREDRERPKPKDRDSERKDRDWVKEESKTREQDQRRLQREKGGDKYRERESDKYRGREGDKYRDSDKSGGKERDKASRPVLEKAFTKDSSKKVSPQDQKQSSPRGGQGKRDEPSRSVGKRQLERNERDSPSKPKIPSEDRTSKNQESRATSTKERQDGERRSSDRGRETSEGSTEKSGKLPRGKEVSDRLRNKDRPTMAIYQPGQRLGLKGQDDKEGGDRRRDQRSSPRDGGAKSGPPQDRGKGSEDRRNGRRDGKDMAREQRNGPRDGGAKSGSLQDRGKSGEERRDGRRDSKDTPREQRPRDGGAKSAPPQDKPKGGEEKRDGRSDSKGGGKGQGREDPRRDDRNRRNEGQGSRGGWRDDRTRRPQDHPRDGDRPRTSESSKSGVAGSRPRDRGGQTSRDRDGDRFYEKAKDNKGGDRRVTRDGEKSGERFREKGDDVQRDRRGGDRPRDNRGDRPRDKDGHKPVEKGDDKKNDK